MNNSSFIKVEAEAREGTKVKMASGSVAVGPDGMRYKAYTRVQDKEKGKETMVSEVAKKNEGDKEWVVTTTTLKDGEYVKSEDTQKDFNVQKAFDNAVGKGSILTSKIFPKSGKGEYDYKGMHGHDHKGMHGHDHKGMHGHDHKGMHGHDYKGMHGHDYEGGYDGRYSRHSRYGGGIFSKKVRNVFYGLVIVAVLILIVWPVLTGTLEWISSGASSSWWDLVRHHSFLFPNTSNELDALGT